MRTKNFLVPAGSGETGDTAPTPRIHVVLNWSEELKRLGPTGRSMKDERKREATNGSHCSP